MHYLYSITNQVNGKVYIGQTIKPDYRWYQHCSYANKENKHKQYIHHAMAKYGIENFAFEVIASCKTQEDATEIENILMVQYDSCSPQYGYNLVAGVGYGGHSESTKQKIREAIFKQIETQGHPALGTKRTDEQRANISAALKSLDKEVIYTEEVRKNMSEAHLGHKDSEETKKSKSEAQKQRWLENFGELKCNAPNCDIQNIKEYLIVNGVRYCSVHGQRLKKNGSLELKPKVAHNKGKSPSEESRKKCGLANIGKKASNRIEFTQEKIYIMLDPARSVKSLSREFGVTEKVIVRVRREAKNHQIK